MSEIKDRIRQIIVREGLTAGAFAETVGVAQATISHILGSRNKYPSMEFVLRLHQRYPDIDLNWLLTGAGNLSAGDDGVFSSSSASSTDPSESRDEFAGPGLPGLVPDEGYPLFGENAIIQPAGRAGGKNREENASESLENSPKPTVHQEIVYREKPSRKITEIRIFFDDNTYETFLPEK